MPEEIHVLHVDEDPDVAANRLEREADRFTVEVAVNADAGMDRIADEDFDCIVSDRDLPGRNGLEFLKAVREEYPDLPFIIFSEVDFGEVAGDAISAGVTDYLRKHENVDQHAILADRIREAVRDYHRKAEYRRKSRLLDQIFEQAPIHLYVKDEEARYVRLTGHISPNPENEIGKTFPEVRPGEFAERIYEDELEVIETGEPVLNKEEYDPDGQNWILRSQVPWRDDDGEIQGLIGASYHITERKEYEQELEDQKEHLEEFASVVSNNLRNPLNVAEGRLRLARSECDSEHLDAIERAHDRMNSLIDDLVTIAKRGEIIDEIEPIDVAEFMEDCWQNVETTNAELIINLNRVILADRGRFQQLLENLIRNAIEHGGEDVTVSVGELDDGFYVEDDGPGIPEEDRRGVFDAGYSTTEEGKGFGLRIVEQVADAHGWNVRVADGTDGGARFEITDVKFVEW